MSGNFLSCSKGVKDPLEVPEFKFDYPLVASAEMGLISPGGENLLDFLELRQVPSIYDGDIRDPLWWPQERPVHMRVARGPLGIPLPFFGAQLSLQSSSHIHTWLLDCKES